MDIQVSYTFFIFIIFLIKFLLNHHSKRTFRSVGNYQTTIKKCLDFETSKLQFRFRTAGYYHYILPYLLNTLLKYDNNTLILIKIL
jgi:hypothetical protein